ncbi:hypothetical protein DdX_11079 [Ditylenchus destructor]|uniref:Uncharacterized protein n=1 Tax=Ditylenchus destructor TaxID=166010 RepID=A0AAD4MWP7_9BILA|nr:hypothetical protein DdX_11079 [Ditylenchus destructor]
MVGTLNGEVNYIQRQHLRSAAGYLRSAFEVPHASLPPTLFGGQSLGAQQQQPALFAQQQPQPLPAPSQSGNVQLSSQPTGSYGQQQPLVGTQQVPNAPSSWGASYGPQVQGSAPQVGSQGFGSSFQSSASGSSVPQSGTYGPISQPGPVAPQPQPQAQSQGPPPGTPPGFDYWFAEGTPHLYCSYGVNPIPRYNTPHKRCVPNNPACGIVFSCIIDVP